MLSFSHLTTLFVFARCATAGIFTRDSLESPYGLTLTSDSILASRYNASGSVEVVRYPTSPEYRAYYTNAVDNYDKSTIQRSDAELPAHMDARTMFRQIITPITTSLTKREGHKPIYATLFLPSIFDHDIRGVATDVVFEGAYLQRAAFVGSSQIAACNAYPFLKGKHIGRAPDECNDHGPENLILLLEYEKDYLYAWVKDVSFDLGTYPVTNQKICMECGEKFREEIGQQAYEERLHHLVDEVTKTEALHYNSREEIRAIVIAGDASAKGVAALARIARDAVGTAGGHLEYVSEIDASEVAAYGAAAYARSTQRRPEAFTVDAGHTHEHDEL